MEERDGYRDELAAAHDRIAQLEEHVRELVETSQVPPRSRLETLRLDRAAAFAEQGARRRAFAREIAIFAGIAAPVALLALLLNVAYLPTAVAGVGALFGMRGIIIREQLLRTHRAKLVSLDVQIAAEGGAGAAPLRARATRRARRVARQNSEAQRSRVEESTLRARIAADEPLAAAADDDDERQVLDGARRQLPPA